MKERHMAASKQILVGGIFILGAILLLWQHSYVGMYFDDYGNASLSYGYTVPGVNGTGWSVSDLVEWAKWCYIHFGGRILYAVTILIPLLRNGIRVYMALQAVVITAEIWVLYKIICYYRNETALPGVAAMLFGFYGLLGINFHSRGVYWASASILYVWPLLPLFLSIWVYMKLLNKIRAGHKVSAWEMLLLGVLLFFASCSQEQIGIAVIGFYIFYIPLDHYKDWKKYRKYDVMVLLTSIISYALLFCAPGNFSRLDSNQEFASLGLIGKITRNFPEILRVAFMPALNWINLLLAISMILMSVYLVKKSKLFFIEIGISIGCFIGLFFIPGEQSAVPAVIKTFYEAVFIFNLLILSCYYFTETKRPTLIAFVISGGASVFCLLYSPYVVERNYIYYVFIIMMVLGVIFSDAYCQYKNNVLVRTGVVICCLLFSLKSAFNFAEILNGYRLNSAALEYNEKVLSEYDTEQGNQIELLIPNDTTYRAELPCDPTFEYIAYWMREYYDIPDNVDLVWH